MEKPTVTMNKSLRVNSRDKAVLMRTPFMAALNGEALVKMLNAVSITSLPARHIIFREGTEADHFYCVLSGYVRLYRLNREGREADIRVCAPGDTFAECLIYGDDVYRFNAQTAENTTLARFDIRTTRQLAEQEPAIARAIMSCLSHHLLTTMDCVANDRLHTAPQRVAEYLLKSCPVDGGSASVRLPFQKSLLAGMLGLAPEALSRAFSSLRRVGVTVRGRIIQIGDVNALRDV
jgi:cAMP-binding proteins - catabolite gene activator and regulatory subunit of cAMP-dependent protein kinases